jgi:MATE family multidrug resistance protein
MPERTFAAHLADAVGIIVPIALGNALEYAPVVVAIAIVGHLPATGGRGAPRVAAELDAVTLARAYFNITAMAPGFGVITALRTLCPQAVGAGRPHQCALALQRAAVFICLTALPIVPLAYFSDVILLRAGQPADVVALAQPYCVRLLPSYFGVVGFSAVQRVYQAHGLNWSNLAIAAVVCALAPVLQVALVHWAGLGYLGAAWASGGYNALYLALQVPILCALGRGSVFAPLPLAVVLERRGMWEYVRLMAPGMLMCCAEWWILEAVILLAGRLRNPLTAIGAICASANLQAIALMAWIGCAVAAATTVGKAIGAGQVREARAAAAATLAVSLGIGLLVGGAVALLRAPLSRAFTSDAEIDALAAQALPWLGIVMAFDACSNALGGVCSGLGLQRYAAAAQLVGYYAVGMPLGAAGAFWLLGGSERGVLALWAGTALSMLVAALLQAFALLRHDWAKSVAESAARGLVDDAHAAAQGVLPAQEGMRAQLLANPSRADDEIGGCDDPEDPGSYVSPRVPEMEAAQPGVVDSLSSEDVRDVRGTVRGDDS